MNPQNTNKKTASKKKDMWYHHYVKLMLVCATGIFVVTLIFAVYQFGQFGIFQAALIPLSSNLDPLASQNQCGTDNSGVLKIADGSGRYNWKFVGSGINNNYGIVSDGTNEINNIGQTLTTSATTVAYTAPEMAGLSTLGQITVEVEDDIMVDAAGNKQKQTFTVNVRANCIKQLAFMDPGPLSEDLFVRRGVPLEIQQVAALLHNDDTIQYPLPHARIEFAVDPPEAGYFEGNYFYTRRSSGTVRIVAYITGDDAGTAEDSIVGTLPLSLNVLDQQCDLRGTLYLGKGGSFTGDLPTEYSPTPKEPRLKSGESAILFVEDGMERYLYSSSDPEIVKITPYVPGQSGDEAATAADGNGEGEEDADDGTTTPTVPAISELAIVRGVSKGAATVLVTDANGCTALLDVYIDNFLPVIESAKFIGTMGAARGTKKTLHLRVSDLDTIDDLFSIEIQLIKGFYSKPEDIPETAQVFNIIDLEQNIKIETDSPENGTTTAPKFTKLYSIPVFIPEYRQLTDGYYTVLITVRDTRIEDRIYNKISKTLSLYIGKGVGGDLNNDGKADIVDVITALRGLTGKTQLDRPMSIIDIITLLKIVGKGG